MVQAEKKVSILNYNLYCLPWLASMFKPSTCPLPTERAHYFIQSHLSSYDILCLQEVWNPHYGCIERNAKSKGMYVTGSTSASVSRLLNFRVFGGGLMIISKYPIVETREALYERGTGADGFVSKGVIYAKINLGSSFIHVFNTHLQASYGCEYKAQDPYAKIRRKQLKRVAKFINEVTAKDDHPILLMGDFNVNACRTRDDNTDSEEYREMISTLSGDLYTISDLLRETNKNTHPITHEGSGVFGDKRSAGGQRLDFILEVKRRSTSRKVVKHRFTDNEVVPFLVKDKIFAQVSDHYGVSTMLNLFQKPIPNINLSDNTSPTYNLSNASIQLSFQE